MGVSKNSSRTKKEREGERESERECNGRQWDKDRRGGEKGEVGKKGKVGEEVDERKKMRTT